jgi:hypothetical protein
MIHVIFWVTININKYHAKMLGVSYIHEVANISLPMYPI